MCILLKIIGHLDLRKCVMSFNNIVYILLKRIGYFESTDVYGVTHILLKTSQFIPISTMLGCFLKMYM